MVPCHQAAWVQTLHLQSQMCTVYYVVFFVVYYAVLRAERLENCFKFLCG